MTKRMNPTDRLMLMALALAVLATAALFGLSRVFAGKPTQTEVLETVELGEGDAKLHMIHDKGSHCRVLLVITRQGHPFMVVLPPADDEKKTKAEL